jgi:adenylate cyclase
LKRIVPLVIALVIGVLSAIYVLLEGSGTFDKSPILFLEKKIFDYKFLIRGRVPVEPSVLIAAGDEKAIASFGRWGTWDRARYRTILDHLFEAGADVVAFDIVFADPVGIDHDNTEKLKGLLVEEPLSASVGELALRIAEKNGAVSAQELAQLAVRAKAVEDHLAKSTAGDEHLAKAFDDYANQVVQGFIANTNNDEGGEPVAHTPDEIKALEPFVITSFASGWKHVESVEAKAAGAEAQVAQAIPVERKISTLEAVPAVNGTLVLPEKAFLDVASNIGFFSADPDSDGVMRKLPLVYRLGEAFLPSLSLAAASLHFGASPVVFADSFYDDSLARIGFAAEEGKTIEVPVDHSGALIVNYYGPAGPNSMDLPDDKRGTFPRISLADIYDGTFDKAAVKGKIVLVAVTAIGTFDQRVTPFSPIVPGTEIHAAAIQNMISGQAFDRPWLLAQGEMVLALVMAVLLGLLLPRVPVTASAAIVAVLAAGWLGVDFLVVFRKNLWLHDVPMMLQLAFSWAGITVWGYLSEGREKAQLKREFSTVLAPTVVDQLLKDPKLAGLGGMERELTVMFSDIRGFTSMSEKLTPEGLTQFLNEYLTPMTEILIQREGTLDKYMGDAIMAFWGAPIEQKDHAARAALAAIDMMEKLDQLKQKWRAEGKPDIDIGIGLNSGLMRVGFMGSERMRNYTLLGDNVNLGSRLEGTNKNYGTHIIVSETTFNAAKHVVYGRWLDAVRVKGKHQPVNIYELLGRLPHPGAKPPPEMQKLIDVFEAGLKHYRAQQWSEAELAFNACNELRPGGDPTSVIYLERIAHFKEEPPPEKWDGVYEMKTK